MVRQHHQFNGHEFEQIPKDSEGQGSLVCCSSWGHRVRHDLATENKNNLLRIWSNALLPSEKKKKARCFKYELSNVCKTTEVLYQKKELKRKKKYH